MRRMILLASAMLVGLASCRSHSKPEPQHAYLPPYQGMKPAPPVPPRPASPPAQAWRPPPPAARPAPPANAAWLPSNGVISPRWTTIVIHHSATDRGSAAIFDKEHRARGWDELGYHFVIGNGRGSGDGQIEVGPRWYKQKHGAHCKTSDNYFNEHGIGICLVGDFTKSRPTPRQMASLEKLVEFLSARCGIRPDRVTTHGVVTGRTACPGRNFPLQALRRSLYASAAGRSPGSGGTN